MRVILLMMLVSATAVAADVRMAIDKVPEKKLFNAGEFNIDGYGTASILNAQRSKDDVVLGAGLGASYWFTRGFGAGLRAESDNTAHSLVDRGIGRLQVRAPLWDRVAPYGFLDGIFDFERDKWSAGAGGGLEFRFYKGLGVFGEAGLAVNTEGEGRMRGAAGMRLSF